MNTKLRVHFLDDVIQRALETGDGCMRYWLGSMRTLESGAIEGRPRSVNCTYVLVREQVVQRGLWRCQGGQGDRPDGITRELHAEITAADAEQDANLLSVAAASALIQVGLFGRVMFQ